MTSRSGVRPTVDEINDLCLWGGMFASPEAERAGVQRHIAFHVRRDAELKAQLIAKARRFRHLEPPI